MDKINLKEKFSLFDEFWTPKIVGELNGQFVKLAKARGKMIWHAHENEDELFFVVKGKLILHLRDRKIELSEGEMFVVPKGVEHLPEAEDETHILLFEPKSTLHTGNTQTALTVSIEEQDWV